MLRQGGYSSLALSWHHHWRESTETREKQSDGYRELVEEEKLQTAKGDTHKGCPHFRGGRGFATMWTNEDGGREEA